MSIEKREESWLTRLQTRRIVFWSQSVSLCLSLGSMVSHHFRLHRRRRFRRSRECHSIWDPFRLCSRAPGSAPALHSHTWRHMILKLSLQECHCHIVSGVNVRMSLSIRLLDVCRLIMSLQESNLTGSCWAPQRSSSRRWRASLWTSRRTCPPRPGQCRRSRSVRVPSLTSTINN